MKVKVKSFSCVQLFVIPWTVAYQAPQSVEFSRQEYWLLLLLLLSRFSHPTLCDPIDSGPPGSAVPGILQARTLEWVAISFSRGSSQPRD